jgi:hypothetical protein
VGGRLGRVNAERCIGCKQRHTTRDQRINQRLSSGIQVVLDNLLPVISVADEFIFEKVYICTLVSGSNQRMRTS